MTTATPKPRAGEHVPGNLTRMVEGDLLAEYRYCEASFNGMRDHALELEAERDRFKDSFLNAASELERTIAERDLLRERERELVEALETILRAEFGSGMVVPAGCESTYWGKARALLAKHGR